MRSLIIISIFSTLMLVGCSGHGLQDWADETFNERQKEEVTTQKTQTTVKEEETSPSADPGLNTISPSKTATSKGGTMQKNLDSWTEQEWTPAIEQNKTVKGFHEDEERPFLLQEYVDKAGVYMENKPKSSRPSHTEKLDKLPVIGE